MGEYRATCGGRESQLGVDVNAGFKIGLGAERITEAAVRVVGAVWVMVEFEDSRLDHRSGAVHAVCAGFLLTMNAIIVAKTVLVERGVLRLASLPRGNSRSYPQIWWRGARIS